MHRSTEAFLAEAMDPATGDLAAFGAAASAFTPALSELLGYVDRLEGLAHRVEFEEPSQRVRAPIEEVVQTAGFVSRTARELSGKLRELMLSARALEERCLAVQVAAERDATTATPGD